MKKATFNTLLVGGGFLLGTAGIKALTSAPAKKVFRPVFLCEAYVHGIACGLRAKNCYQDMVEQAKAEVDDLVAEATYLTSDAKAAKADSEPSAE